MRFFYSYLAIIILFSSCKQTKGVEPESESWIETPNIVLLIGDDQGYPYFGFMGADYVKTPNMDALAESGIVFESGYVPANHCRPSLQSLMTGTLPIDYNNQVNAKMIKERMTMKFASEEDAKNWERNFKFHAMKHFNTLPKQLRTKGYKSFQGGKWWEFHYENGGFDEGMTTGWTKEDEGKNDWFLKFMGGEGRDLVRRYMDPVYKFIDENKEEPMFIWFAPELPHYPFDAPDEYYNIYKDEDMSESAKRYYANCTWFDTGVGDLIAYLKEKDEFDNTLFVYVNDNGWEQAPQQEFRHDSLRWHNGGDKGKLSMFDQSFRTPIIFSWKDKVEAGKRRYEIVHSTDIPATLLHITGVDQPDDYYGSSLYGILMGESQPSRAKIIGKVGVMRSEDDMMGKKVEGYWMRTADYFFNWNMTTGERALFDMEKDPNNDRNLADLNPELVKQFSQEILSWRSTKIIEE